MGKPNIVADWKRTIASYRPQDAREEAEQREMLDLIAREGDRLLSRECAYAHMTASSIIVNHDRSKTLLAFHKIYNSWAWTGGHADGDGDFEAVARREAQEETGIGGLRLLGGSAASLEVLPVWAHVRRGQTVGSHLHLNVSYLFEANEGEPLRVARRKTARWAGFPLRALKRRSRRKICCRCTESCSTGRTIVNSLQEICDSA